MGVDTYGGGQLWGSCRKGFWGVHLGYVGLVGSVGTASESVNVVCAGDSLCVCVCK